MDTRIGIAAAIGLGTVIGVGLHRLPPAQAASPATDAATLATTGAAPASRSPDRPLPRSQMARLIAEQTAILTEREVLRRQRLETAENVSTLP